MFIIEQIKTAHSKVKSGADFTDYIQELKILGVTLSIALTSKKNSLSQTLKPTNRAKQTTRPSAAIEQRQVSRNGLLTCTK